MKILILEDDENKRQQIEKVLHIIFNDCTLSVRKSYNSGLRAVTSNEAWDLILLDMTMPTYDIGLDEDGGRPQHYAGRSILRQMKRYSVKTPVIVITQFDAFGEGSARMTREALDEQLHQEHQDIYLGTVYYNAAEEGWKDSLIVLIGQLPQNQRRIIHD